MKTYNFTLKLDTKTHDDQTVDNIYKAGCDDGLLYSDASGVYIDFSRQRESWAEALKSAKADLNKAGYQVTNIIWRIE